MQTTNRQPGIADRTHSQTHSKTLPVITRSHTHTCRFTKSTGLLLKTHTLWYNTESWCSAPLACVFTVHMPNMPPVVAYSCNGTVPHLTINTLLSAHLLKYDSRPPLWPACLVMFLPSQAVQSSRSDPVCVCRSSPLAQQQRGKREDRVEELVSVLHVCSGRGRCFSLTVRSAANARGKESEWTGTQT